MAILRDLRRPQVGKNGKFCGEKKEKQKWNSEQRIKKKLRNVDLRRPHVEKKFKKITKKWQTKCETGKNEGKIMRNVDLRRPQVGK